LKPLVKSHRRTPRKPTTRFDEEAVMESRFELVYGLPQKELIERLHFHRRQGEVSERALGFYLLDMERRNAFKPEVDAPTYRRHESKGGMRAPIEERIAKHIGKVQDSGIRGHRSR
jgi:hypothetical protein